jgi:uncharacterized protein
LADDEAMWFDWCSAVHTMGMRVAIDVVFLDREGTVIRLVSPAQPWCPWIGARGACNVLELAAGACARIGIEPGMRLELQWDSPT